MKIQKKLRQESGLVLVLLPIVLVVLCQFTAFAVDAGLAYEERHRMQIGTDAAALAGLLAFTSGSATFGEAQLAIEEAEKIALANGITNEELQTGGGIEAGFWSEDTKTFLPNGLPYNSLRVRARRQVPTSFANVMGIAELNPSASSTAYRSFASEADCLVPFGLLHDFVTSHQYGDVITIGNVSPGNWGKLDIGGNMSSANNFRDAFQTGVCHHSVEIGDMISPGTGFAGVSQAFQDRLNSNNPIATFALVETFNVGNSVDVHIVGFTVAEIISHTSQGQNWTAQLRILNTFGGGGSGGPNNGASPRTRVLVQ